MPNLIESHLTLDRVYGIKKNLEMRQTFSKSVFVHELDLAHVEFEQSNTYKTIQHVWYVLYVQYLSNNCRTSVKNAADVASVEGLKRA